MNVSTSKGLYKYLLRECQKLPKDANEFYKHTIKQVRVLQQRIYFLPNVNFGTIIFVNCALQSYKQHMLESDPARVKQIIERALEDASWVVKKVSST
jgi:hypothetical protein